MKLTICSKCGITADGRKPTGWHDVVTPDCTDYYDFCPKCYEEYTRVREAAENTKKATITAWLNEVVPKKSSYIPRTIDDFVTKR